MPKKALIYGTRVSKAFHQGGFLFEMKFIQRDVGVCYSQEKAAVNCRVIKESI